MKETINPQITLVTIDVSGSKKNIVGKILIGNVQGSAVQHKTGIKGIIKKCLIVPVGFK